MQGLKVAVVGMGVLLIVGVCALVYAIVAGAGKDAAPGGLAAGVASGLAVAAPGGGELISVAPDGDRLFLHFKQEQGAQILILDLRSGDVLGEIDVSAP
jgi:hypothetical protein